MANYVSLVAIANLANCSVNQVSEEMVNSVNSMEMLEQSWLSLLLPLRQPMLMLAVITVPVDPVEVAATTVDRICLNVPVSDLDSWECVEIFVYAVGNVPLNCLWL